MLNWRGQTVDKQQLLPELMTDAVTSWVKKGKVIGAGPNNGTKMTTTQTLKSYERLTNLNEPNDYKFVCFWMVPCNR
jgi:hypothetical protein